MVDAIVCDISTGISIMSMTPINVHLMYQIFDACFNSLDSGIFINLPNCALEMRLKLENFTERLMEL